MKIFHFSDRQQTTVLCYEKYGANFNLRSQLQLLKIQFKRKIFKPSYQRNGTAMESYGRTKSRDTAIEINRCKKKRNFLPFIKSPFFNLKVCENNLLKRMMKKMELQLFMMNKHLLCTCVQAKFYTKVTPNFTVKVILSNVLLEKSHLNFGIF